VAFEDLHGASYSNSAQVELAFQPFERLGLRLAYRFLDVRQSAGGVLRERPFVSRHRAFLNLAYGTTGESEDDPRMSYDLTIQWMGSKRLPVTAPNPAAYRARADSPPYALVNAQVTRSFTVGFDLYLGVENLLGFRQDTPVIDAAHPNSSYFDSSLIWGPVNGRVVYGGLRWGI
jgi:outer membrane receptor protein involved in Fe transport